MGAAPVLSIAVALLLPAGSPSEDIETGFNECGAIVCMEAPNWLCLTGGTGFLTNYCNAYVGSDPFERNCGLP